jgi:hypothetical protein
MMLRRMSHGCEVHMLLLASFHLFWWRLLMQWYTHPHYSAASLKLDGLWLNVDYIGRLYALMICMDCSFMFGQFEDVTVENGYQVKMFSALVVSTGGFKIYRLECAGCRLRLDTGVHLTLISGNKIRDSRNLVSDSWLRDCRKSPENRKGRRTYDSVHRRNELLITFFILYTLTKTTSTVMMTLSISIMSRSQLL